MLSMFTCNASDAWSGTTGRSMFSTRQLIQKYRYSLLPVLMACLFFINPLKSIGQTVQAWGDAIPGWTASTLNDARSDYFQGEVIPFVYKFPSAALLNGSSYTFNIKYDFYHATDNAGGYAFMTTYNISRDPDESAIGPNPTLDATATAANVGNFYTVNADITSAVFLADIVSGSTTTKEVQVTFTFTGTPGDDVIVYWGLFLAKTGSVPDQGSGVTEGASHWPGGSLQVVVEGTGGGGNVGNNPGAGGVVEGVISGKKYSDADQSGDKGNSEPGLAGWTIYLDLNNNNVFDGDDISDVTDGNGDYSFGDLLPGTYTVREVNQAGFTQTEPGGPDFEHVIVIDAANPNHSDNNFGNYECPVNGGGTATAAASPICSGTATTVTLSGQTGNIVKWQYSTDGSTWTDINSTDNPLNTGNLTQTTQFRAVVQSGACNAQNSSAATVVVDQPSVGGSAAAAVSPICAGSSTTVSLSGNAGAIVKWQYSTDGSTWNDIASTANPLNTGVLVVTTQFRAVVQNGACSSENSSAATVTVDQATVGGSAAAGVSPICAGSSTTVSLSGNTGAIVKWQYSTDGSTWNDIASTANPLNTGVLVVTTQFRAVVQNGACSSENSSAATVVVDDATVGGSAAAGVSPICAFSSSTVSLSGNTGAIVKWQYSTDGSTWNDIASTANPLNTGILVLTTQFRAVVQNGACSSENSFPATIVVNPTTVGGTATATTTPVCEGSSTTVSLSGNTGDIVKWQYSTDGSTWNDINSTDNPLNTGALTVTTQFRAVVQSGVCSSQNSSAATVTVTPSIDVISFTGNQTVTYPNNATFCVVASNVSGYDWYKKPPAGILAIIPGENGSCLTVISPPVSASGTEYKVVMHANSPCGDSSRTGILTVNPASMCLTYDGLTFGTTNTNGCYVTDNGYGPGVIRLILTVVGNPPGDISTAVVRLTIPGSLNNVLATFVPAQNGNPAYFYYNWSVPCLGNTVNSVIHELTWTIGGNYTSGNCTETEALITISRPTTDFTTGGGYIFNNKSKGQIGIQPNETPSKNNYGFNLKWGNNLKILQGNFNTIVRQGGKHYQIKSNKPTFLSTKALTPYTIDNKTYYPYEAVMVYENAVFKDLTTGTSQGGGPSSVIYARIIDNGEPNTAGTQRIDQISILYRLANTVIYSSEEYTVINNPAVLKLMDIVKGNIQVHVNGGKNGMMVQSQPVLEQQVVPAQQLQLFELKAAPNPAPSQFTLQITSDNRTEKMQLRVTDISGRTVQVFTNLSAGTTLRIGSGYQAGVYFAELSQGVNRKQIKLVKL